jgi:hypothetical protein
VGAGNAQSRSEARTGIIGARRASAFVDAFQVNRGDAEVAVAELALDNDQRHSFVGHLDKEQSREPRRFAATR